jgi:nuclear pore complex protein Nup155
MIERLIELLSLWQIITEHRTDMLIERLPESYLALFNGTNGPFTVRTLLDLDTLFYDTLVAALLTSYEQNESIFDQLMGRLVDECPKLCPIEKLILYKVDLFLKPSSTSLTNQTINDQHQRLKQACQLYKQVCDRVNITSFAMTLYTFRMYDELLDLCVTAASKRDPCNQALNYYYGQLDDQQQFHDVYQRRSECYQALIDILELLYQRDGQTTLKTNDGSLTLNEFLRHCLSYDDEFLHVKLFDWMMNKQFNEKMKSFRQMTPYLERFIRYRLKLTNFNDYITLDVAIAILQVVKDYTTLCQVLLHLIDLSDPHVTFADRLCYLAEALQIARSASAALISTSSTPQQTKSNSDRQLVELIPTLEQRLQTAFVQKQIYTDLQMYMRALETHTITSTNINEELQQCIQQMQESIGKLDSALFDATELFVDYAEKYELYECQLLLLQLDGTEEPSILQTIWRRLLRKEVNDLFPSTGNLTGGHYDRIITLQHHLIERLRNCRKKRLRLPLDFIRSELKQIVHTLNNLSGNGDLISTEDFSNQILSDL